MNYLAFAIPAFFFFLLLEYLAYGKRKQKMYSYENSVSNIAVGILERLLDLFIAGSFYGIYRFLYQRFALFEISTTWYNGVILLLAADFMWYWYHRLGHMVNFFWAAHIVHHQSEDFNYTVSARITTFQSLVRTIFWCMLPILGFHPDMVLIILAIHGGYSFFTHTQLIKNTRFLEWMLITPSLHGVHHASNAAYLDKNFGDVFVFWDKLFGTFKQEDEQPVYGLTHPLKSNSFLWMHFHYYLEILEGCKRRRGLKNKLGLLFGSPDQMDQDIRPSLEKKFLVTRRLKSVGKPRFQAYINTQLLICVFLLTVFSLFYAETLVPERIFVFLFVLISLINCGAILEQRRYIYYLEYIRLFFIFIFLSYHFSAIEYLVWPTFSLFVLEMLFPLNKWYLRYVLKLSAI